jgi:hypothetical protein
MKATPLLFAALLLGSCTSYERIGSMTMVSTRNVEKDAPYVLLASNVEGYSDRHQDEPMQEAIDDAVHQKPGGEFMKNVAIYVRSNGRDVKVQGDVWGIPRAADTTPTATQVGSVTFRVGDKVLAKLVGHSDLVPATIIALQEEKAVIQYERVTQRGTQTKMKAVWFDDLTKVAQ